jgi:CheY-like chemotaxis protein
MLRLLETERPDLILLDVMMPDGDGRDAAKAMRGRPELRDIPVVMMSAGVSLQQLSVPTAGVLRKPFDLYELLDLVSNAIGPAT